MLIPADGPPARARLPGARDGAPPVVPVGGDGDAGASVSTLVLVDAVCVSTVSVHQKRHPI